MTVDADAAGIDDITELLVERFHEEHERTYGRRADDEPIDLVTIRSTYRIALEQSIPSSSKPPAVQHEPRVAYFGGQHGAVTTSVVSRDELAGSERTGPLIVDEYDSTTLVPPDALVHLDEMNNIVIDIGDEPSGGGS